MLSYMLPVEEKTSPPRNLNLNLHLKMTTSEPKSSSTSSRINGNCAETCDENTKLLASEREYNHKSCFTTRDQKLDNISKQNGKEELSNASGEEGDESKTTAKKGKLSKIGNKNVTLKRVSFGSSKGSMVETLVFETPTPLPEHAEREFGYGLEVSTTPSLPGANKLINFNTNNNNINNNFDDSGIELQEELERSKVRVTFFQSSKPQQISPPESYCIYSDNNFLLLSEPSTTEGSTLNSDTMTAATAQPPSYDRQMSTESGWDNPFRPGGDLSREADEIVNMIKDGKPITPTSDVSQSIANGSAQKDTQNNFKNGTAVLEGATKIEVSQNQTAPAQNGTKSPQSKAVGGKANGDAKPAHTQVSNQVIPGPTSASHVIIEDKKKKKCTCCVIQ